MCLGASTLLLDITIVIVALPDVRTRCTPGSDIQRTIDAHSHSLSLAAVLPPSGSLADQLGSRAGLLLMRGQDATTSWRHLISGFVPAGLGSGLVNAPLASTAVGSPRRRTRGMASGTTTTSRQAGTATRNAALGTIFASRMRGLDPGPGHAAGVAAAETGAAPPTPRTPRAPAAPAGRTASRR